MAHQKVTTMSHEDLSLYFAGEKLYGDDFAPSQVQAWFDDEKEGYADLGAKNAGRYRYVYHALNALHGFRHLPARSFAHALGLGSAYGDEFEPIAHRLDRITILEPSDTFARDTLFGMPVAYVKPRADGTLPFADDTFDLITCLGVLHHIPNVSFVVGELYRCLKPAGYLLVREPVISMGDWTRPRPGLTKRERGIPLPIFRHIFEDTGFTIRKETVCMFPLLPKLWQMFGKPAYNSAFATHTDRFFSRLLRWNLRYHATSPLQKFRPTSVYYVLTRQEVP
jgi:SAM-dependent methyltransferase